MGRQIKKVKRTWSCTTASFCVYSHSLSFQKNLLGTGGSFFWEDFSKTRSSALDTGSVDEPGDKIFPGSFPSKHQIIIRETIQSCWQCCSHHGNGSTLACLALLQQGFPGSSAGKESACNAGDPGSISGSGKSPGEGIGYALQYSWASLVAQLVKNLPAMWETWV